MLFQVILKPKGFRDEYRTLDVKSDTTRMVKED